MKFIIHILRIGLLFFCSLTAIAQKALIDNQSYRNWPELREFETNVSSLISNNGEYVVYTYSINSQSRIVIQSLSRSFKREFNFNDVSRPVITEDNKRVVFLLPHDSLAVLELNSLAISYLSNVQRFAVSKESDSIWLAYQLNNVDRTFVLVNLINKSERRYSNVDDFHFNTRNSIVLKTKESILWRDLDKGMDKVVYNGEEIANLTFDDTGCQLAFVSIASGENMLYYYKRGMDSSINLFRGNNKILNGMKIANERLSFSPNGESILFSVRTETEFGIKEEKTSGAINVEVWSAKDPILPSRKFNRNIHMYSLVATVSIANPQMIILTDNNLDILRYFGNSDKNHYLLGQNKINPEEFYWNGQKQIYYLISKADGSRTVITSFMNTLSRYITLSPNERFVVWFDNGDRCYYSYEITSKKVRNISSKIPIPLYDEDSEIIDRKQPFGIAGWLTGDTALLVYDYYDIWSIDPLGLRLPINLTKGNGRATNIIYRRVEKEGNEFKEIKKDTLLIAAFNTINKENGFWKLCLNEGNDFINLTMGPYVYFFPKTSSSSLTPLSVDIPQRAKDENIYVVRRMSSMESPNLYVTRDFTEFEQITNINPEKRYNWLTTELIRYQTNKGREEEGILYKPENFDSSFKYPVIFHYYEKLSNRLNAYEYPRLSSGGLSIPWYVSNGFLVFVPNMHYETAKLEMSILCSIESAVRKLSKFSWFDKNKIGLQGHSFGGFETLMIIANTKLFAAAQESAGYSNSINYYSQSIGLESNRNNYFDLGQGNMGCSPWDNPDLYVKSSPIFHVHNIKTPLLILHNAGDDNVSFSQSIEMFTALRRLKRDAWLLNYPEENHSLYQEVNKLDFTVRQQEFFQYYLQAKPIPTWMTEMGN